MKLFIKKIFIVILLLILSSSLYANQISAEGYGETISEAKNNAAEALANQITISINTIQKIFIREDLNSSSSDYFYSDTELSSNVELYNVQYKNVKNIDNNVSIVAYIDEENSLNLYLEKLKSIKKEIDYLEDVSLLDNSSKKYNLILLMDYYNQFSAYKNIVLSLNSNVNIPKLEKTKAGIELDLYNLLSKEVSALEISYNNMINKSASPQNDEKDTALAKYELEKIANQLSRSQEKLNLLNEIEREEKQKLLDSLDDVLKKNVEKMNEEASKIVVSNIADSDNPIDLINEIEKQKQNVYKLLKKSELEITKQEEVVKSRFIKEYNELENSPYRAGEIANGEPTKIAIEFREKKLKEIENDMMEELNSIRYKLSLVNSENSYNLIKKLNDKINILEGKAYENLDCKIKVGKFDGYTKQWPIAIRFTVLGEEFSIDTSISYIEVTNEEIPNLNPNSSLEEEKYNNYLYNIDLYNSFFYTTDNPISVTANYSIEEVGASQYLIKLNNLHIYNNATNKLIVHKSYNETNSISKIFKYLPAVDLKDLLLQVEEREKIKKYENDFAVEYEKINDLMSNRVIMDGIYSSLYLGEGFYFSLDFIDNINKFFYYGLSSSIGYNIDTQNNLTERVFVSPLIGVELPLGATYYYTVKGNNLAKVNWTKLYSTISFNPNILNLGSSEIWLDLGLVGESDKLINDSAMKFGASLHFSFDNDPKLYFFIGFELLKSF